MNKILTYKNNIIILLIIFYFAYYLSQIIPIVNPKYIIFLAIGFILFPILLINKKFGIALFILVSIFPNLQFREMFGIKGLNLMNALFLLVSLQYGFEIIIKKNGDFRINKELNIFKILIILGIFQLFYTIRILVYNQRPEASTIDIINGELIKPFEYYFILYIILKSIKSYKDIYFYFTVIYIATAIGTFGLFWYYLRYDPYSVEVWNNPIFGHKGDFSKIMAINLLISILLFIYTNIKYKKIIFIIGFLSGLVMIYSLSRTTWIAFSFAILFLIYRSKNWKLFILVSFIAVLLLFSPIYNLLENRITEGIGSGDVDRILAGRITTFWSKQINSIISNPILGGGDVLGGYFGHSGYLEMWNHLTLPGLILVFVFFFKLWKSFKNWITQYNHNNILKAFSLTGMSIVIMAPFLNITTSLEPFRGSDLPPMFILIFLYIACLRIVQLENIKIEK